MHAHKRQWDLWLFTRGRAFVQLYDPKTGGFTGLCLQRREQLLAIPPGIAHGFYAETDVTLTYFLTEEYDGSDEFGFDAYDPDYPGADYWPDADLVLRSERDKNAPSLAEFIAAW